MVLEIQKGTNLLASYLLGNVIALGHLDACDSMMR